MRRRHARIGSLLSSLRPQNDRGTRNCWNHRVAQGKYRRCSRLRHYHSRHHFPAYKTIQAESIRPLSLLAIDFYVARRNRDGICRQGGLLHLHSDTALRLSVWLADCSSGFSRVGVRMARGDCESATGRALQTSYYWRFRRKGVGCWRSSGPDVARKSRLVWRSLWLSAHRVERKSLPVPRPVLPVASRPPRPPLMLNPPLGALRITLPACSPISRSFPPSFSS